MNTQLLEKLLKYIDARIEEKSELARNSYDGGLIESVRSGELRHELEYFNQSLVDQEDEEDD